MADQAGIRASFLRGGTSKGLFFRWEDLPADVAARDRFLCAAIGSPDPNGRQLDGMGGGVSSLSKAMLVRQSSRPGVDVDYLFAQVAVDAPVVDYGGNCGNLSAAVGVFAVDQGLVRLSEGPGRVAMFNENTGKRIDCHLTVRGCRAAVHGDAGIAGVAGQGSAVRLEFLEPGGSRTGRLLAGGPRMGVTLADGRTIDVSFVDAGNPCVFVTAGALGLTGAELPAEIAAMPDVMAALDVVRRTAGVAAGLGDTPQAVPGSVPKVALVGTPASWRTLAGETLPAEDCDVQVRMISMGKPHLAIPLTGALCTAVAARVAGTVVAEVARAVAPGRPLRIGTASGVVPAFSEVADGPDGPHAQSASILRTARTLMEGTVYAPIEMPGYRLEAAE